MTQSAPIPKAIESSFRRCGYSGGLLGRDVRVGETHVAELVGFAHKPHDARSSCVALVVTANATAADMKAYRPLGAPVVFAWNGNRLDWWEQRRGGASLRESVTADKLAAFFDRHRDDLAPGAVYRAKTWGSFDTKYQLRFVDVGLMPVVESEAGQELTDLIERAVKKLLQPSTHGKEPSRPLARWAIQSAFRLLAGKILRDKRVPNFVRLRLLNPEDVLRRVGRHYGEADGAPETTRPQKDGLCEASRIIADFADLSVVTPESLSYVYESALVENATRRKLGIHSTPAFLVDYVVERVAPLIEGIPVAERHVFEPACGHAAFLVAALRKLRDLLPKSMLAPKRLKPYLRQHLSGVEIDGFALEIARLSLTLADIPNPNGWQLTCGDMFAGRMIEQGAAKASVLLANPPFENFTDDERFGYERSGFPVEYGNKAAEMLNRALPHMREGAVLGVVLPQGLLVSPKTTRLRERLLTDFEVFDICALPDKVFGRSEAESATIVARKIRGRERTRRSTSYASVREPDIEQFKRYREVAWRADVSPERFVGPDWKLLVPDLCEVWDWCLGMPRLSDFACVGKGFDFIAAADLPPGTIATATDFFPGSVAGFKNLRGKPMIHAVPTEVHMDLDWAVGQATSYGAIEGTPQIVMNYARASRGPWRIKAFIDRAGHPATSRFLAVRPIDARMSLAFLWALLNSPLANAYVFAHVRKRDIPVSTMNALPVPQPSASDATAVTERVTDYLVACRDSESKFFAPRDSNKLRHLLTLVDAEVLRLYDLPARMERRLLDLFAGEKRPGVPFDFDRYYPPDYTPCFNLHEYLSDDYQRSTAGALRERGAVEPPEGFVEALSRAVEAFKG